MQLKNKKTAVWDYSEIILESDFSGNPFIDIQLSATFKHKDQSIRVSGFYDGNNTWKIRFMPALSGVWGYETESNLPSLDGKKGEIECFAAKKNVHGMVGVSGKKSFVYSDGTPYYPVGTTCYVWNLQNDDLEKKTLDSLKEGPFNKIRFCVYPKRYTFNHNEPQAYPFRGQVGAKWNSEDQDDYTPKPHHDWWDYDWFNPEYFAHIDKCVLQLRELGIEADLILFHPYDFGAWGFDCIPEEANKRILSYLIARLGAFRNIWWSFANEFDFFQNKAIQEWDRYINFVEEHDPYNHLRSIHNGRIFYDHSNPKITHCSIQSAEFKKIPEWFDLYQKPIVIDECGYEGNIDRDWGNISAQEMVHRFWQGFASGAFVGHGETYMHPEDTLWWSKGGELHGESPARIKFLRDIIEGFPFLEIEQFKRREGFMKDLGAGMAYGHFPDFGLYYFGDHQPSFRDMDLPESYKYRIDLIDPWEMTIKSFGEKLSGKFRLELPGKPRMAIRVEKI